MVARMTLIRWNISADDWGAYMLQTSWMTSIGNSMAKSHPTVLTQQQLHRCFGHVCVLGRASRFPTCTSVVWHIWCNPPLAHLVQPTLGTFAATHPPLSFVANYTIACANYTIAEYVLCHTTHTCGTGDAQPQIMWTIGAPMVHRLARVHCNCCVCICSGRVRAEQSTQQNSLDTTFATTQFVPSILVGQRVCGLRLWASNWLCMKWLCMK